MPDSAADPIVGWNPSTRTWSTQRDEPGTPAVPREVAGALHGGEDWLTWAADDWGHMVHHRPRAVFTPTRPDEVAALLRWADEARIRVAARGGAHSVWGQAQARGGIVIDMSGLAEVENVSATRMTVQAGARWTAVLDRAVHHGLTPPVLTDYLSTSVGGTLSAGGVGGASHRWGLQVDQIAALEVATPRGGLLWCDPQRDWKVFDAVRGGQGQVGVITRAVLRLTPAPAQVCRRQLFYPEPAEFLADQRRCVADRRFDYLEGRIQPTEGGRWGFVLEGVSHLDGRASGVSGEATSGAGEDPVTDDLGHDHALSTTETLDYVQFADRMAPTEALARASGAWFWPHPSANAFVPDSRIESVVEAALAQIPVDGLGIGGVILLYPLDASLVRAPLTRVGPERRCWLLSLLRTAPPDDPTVLEACHRDHVAHLERVRAAGGHVYPINAEPTTQAQWREHYGEHWNLLASAKRTHDPHDILAPGPGIFADP